MQALIDSASYMAHGYCLLWQPWLVVLYAGSDLLIFTAYAVIPLALIRFLRKRPDVKFRGLVALFASFILLCGLTHLVSVLTLWVPVYPLAGALKLVTGIVSAITAIVLLRLVPVVVALPAPDDLREANEKLREEIEAHKMTAAELMATQEELERKVARRTLELEESNARLEESNARLELVTRETVHRAKNLLTVVQSIARQTQRSAPDADQFVDRFNGRLDALAKATGRVMTTSGGAMVDLESLLRDQLEPQFATFPGRLTLGGPAQPVRTEIAQQFALAVHELATNAVKYGALATEEGRVDISWRHTGEHDEILEFVWSETGSRGEQKDPEASGDGGFGTMLLQRAVPLQMRGTAEREFAPTGMTYRLTVPVENLSGSDATDAIERTEGAFPVAAQ